MATVRLTDIIDVTIFQDIPAVDSPELTAFWTSGVVVGSPLLDMLANGAGKKAELPFWNDIDAAIEANLSSDDPAAIAAAQKIDQGETRGRTQCSSHPTHSRNQHKIETAHEYEQ